MAYDGQRKSSGWMGSCQLQQACPYRQGDAFEANFFILRDLFFNFCKRVHDLGVLFELLCFNALEIAGPLGTKRFDCIELRTCSYHPFRSPTYVIMAILAPTPPSTSSRHF